METYEYGTLLIAGKFQLLNDGLTIPAILLAGDDMTLKAGPKTDDLTFIREARSRTGEAQLDYLRDDDNTARASNKAKTINLKHHGLVGVAGDRYNIYDTMNGCIRDRLSNFHGNPLHKIKTILKGLPKESNGSVIHAQFVNNKREMSMFSIKPTFSLLRRVGFGIGGPKRIATNSNGVPFGIGANDNITTQWIHNVFGIDNENTWTSTGIIEQVQNLAHDLNAGGYAGVLGRIFKGYILADAGTGSDVTIIEIN